MGLITVFKKHGSIYSNLRRFCGSLHIKGYDQDASVWVKDGTTQVDIIGKTACSMQIPEIFDISR